MPSCLAAAAVPHEGPGVQRVIPLAYMIFGHAVSLVSSALPYTILLFQKLPKGVVNFQVPEYTGGLHNFSYRAEGMHLPTYTWPTIYGPAYFPNTNT